MIPDFFSFAIQIEKVTRGVYFPIVYFLIYILSTNLCSSIDVSFVIEQLTCYFHVTFGGCIVKRSATHLR